MFHNSYLISTTSYLILIPNMNTINTTNFKFPNQTDFYKGKVRDVYSFENLLVMVASDRISAFDVGFPRRSAQFGRQPDANAESGASHRIR